MSIAILCPTRGRPEQCQRMIESAFKMSAGKVQLYIAVSGNEFEVYKSALFVPDQNRVGVCMVEMPDGMPTAHKWNRLAELAARQPAGLFMLGSDDMYFDTPGWDKALIDHYNSLENKIHCYALQDSRDIDGTPHVIVTREWIDALGYFVPPIFLHWKIDTWTVEIARSSGVFTHLREFKLIHDKPSDKGNGDETFRRIRSFGWRERDDYVAKTCDHFLEVEKERLAKCLIR